MDSFKPFVSHELFETSFSSLKVNRDLFLGHLSGFSSCFICRFVACPYSFVSRYPLEYHVLVECSSSFFMWLQILSPIFPEKLSGPCLRSEIADWESVRTHPVRLNTTSGSIDVSSVSSAASIATNSALNEEHIVSQALLTTTSSSSGVWIKRLCHHFSSFFCRPFSIAYNVHAFYSVHKILNARIIVSCSPQSFWHHTELQRVAKLFFTFWEK